MTLSATVRQLIQLGLAQDIPLLGAASDHAIVAMSALVAAEHAVLMVASVLPEGERRMRELATRAVAAAEERMAEFEETQR